MKKLIEVLKKQAEFVVIIIAALISISLWKAGAYRKIEYKAYDAMLPFTKEIKTDSPLLLVEIDDFAIDQVGDWPWTRDIMGNALLRMKELGAERVVFDIEYLSSSNLALNQKTLEKIDSYNDVNSLVNNLVINPDDYFSRCLQFFGNSWLTFNMQNMGLNRTEEEQNYARKRFGLPVTDEGDFVAKGNEAVRHLEYIASGVKVDKFLTPAVSPVIDAAKGAGFTNCFIDLDGIRRRIQLLEKNEDSYIGQLVFAPLVNLMDVKEIKRTKSHLILNDALLPGKGERHTINIPLDDAGCMLINWLHAPYNESFGGNLGNVKENRHESLAFLNQLDLIEEYIGESLAALSNADFIEGELYSEIWNKHSFFSELARAKNNLLDFCNGYDIEGNALEGGLDEAFTQQYIAYRSEFFDSLTVFSEKLAAYAEKLLFITDTKLSSDQISYICQLIKALCGNVNVYNTYVSEMKEKYNGALCLIGFTANASTDFGTTPFDRIYANLGVHANVANTILHEDFIRPLSEFWGLFFAFILVILVVFLVRKCTLAQKITFGLIYVFLVIALLVVLMVGFKIFIPLAMSSVFVLLSFIGNTSFNFIQLEKDRRTLRRGFDAYVAPEVVNQIVKNPDKLKLGGDNKRLTALFSDVRKFSGFTECVNQEEGEERGAVRLVEILNGYLGALSDAIMAQHGTIDKYVGDEIVSFFGAPVDDEENAYHACLAGIKMRQAEAYFNQEHQDELPFHPKTRTPFLLKSRVGLNTGDMVVGNMGTQKKLNYTVMGNNVNLASRLEGTNKEYDSWIIASESTWNDANKGAHKGELIARQLDCVKVINVEKPVQIYSIVGLKNELSSAEIEGADIFNRAMEFYLKGRETPDQPKNPDDFKEAIRLFEESYKCFHMVDPQDPGFISMEKKMIARCNEFLKNGIPGPWDGVYTMTTK
ncbi:CHASE2 domain-containing protein [Treponema sp. C6A8]|uniref:CHASE2 domain-containing protein n=1 Tax=Treponema sp. C6A8 TaxID=1410609 RepID=UPI0004839589|nr:CHASE2 domain-containing protein [Treponema sp. C6A8]